MKMETVIIYKDDKNVKINKEDLSFWKSKGWSTEEKKDKPKKGEKNADSGK